MSSVTTDDVAYYWSASAPLGGAWRDEIERLAAAVPGVVLDVTDGAQTTVRLSDDVGEPVEFRFARRRGGGTVGLKSGPRLVLLSLAVAARLKLELSDGNGNALELADPRALLARIPFSESAAQVECIAEEVGFVPTRIRLEALASARGRRDGVFFV